MVLVRPKSPGNVGSVARAMKNMGFARLVLANPMRFDDPGHFDAEAARMAWSAADLLAARREEPTVQAALAPFTLVIGTTSAPPTGFRTLGPVEAASEAAAHLRSSSGSSAALLFGQEDIGLTSEQLARCHVLARIDASHAYPSLNLSHAAMLFLYETRRALLNGAAPPGPSPGRKAPSQERLEAFFGRMEPWLAEIGFLQGSSGAHMMRELRRLFQRALLTERELAMLEGIVHQAGRASRGRG